MADKNRQILVHLHSADVKVPSSGVLEKGEIAVQYATADPALYIEKADGSIAKFIDSDAIASAISVAEIAVKEASSAYTDYKIATEIDGLGLADAYASKDYESKVDTLIGGDENKSARELAAEEVAKIVASADTRYDTLKEIADWILNDTTGAAKMANDIKELEEVSASTRIAALEAISGASHSHDNKALLDTYTQTEENLADAVAKKHEHANMDVLTGITADKVSAWDLSAEDRHVHTNGDILEDIDSDRVDAWDNAEQNAKDYADTVVKDEDGNYLFDEAGVAEEKMLEVVGSDVDTANDATVYGAKAYAKDYADGLASNYDEAGAAEAVQGNTTETVASVDAKFANYATSADTVAAIEAVAGDSVTGATGDTVVAATVEEHVVKVSATEATVASLALADSSLQGIATDKGAGVTVDTDNKLDFTLMKIDCGTY